MKHNRQNNPGSSEATRARCEAVFERNKGAWMAPQRFDKTAMRLFGEDGNSLMDEGLSQGVLRRGERQDVCLVPSARSNLGLVRIDEEGQVSVRMQDGHNFRVRPSVARNKLSLRDGDLVRIQVSGRSGKYAHIDSIEEPNEKPVEARIERETSDAWIAACIAPRSMLPVRLRKRKGQSFQVGDSVVLEVDRKVSQGFLRGRVLRVGTQAEQASDRTARLVEEFGLDDKPYVVDSAEKQQFEEVIEKAMVDPHRHDMRHIPFVTIDGATARDFDDAVSIETTDFGTRVYVAVADVAEFVVENSALDQDARARGTSVYFPGQVIPMLPFELSEHHCSLRPDEDHLALVVVMEFDANGQRLEAELREAVICSRQRLQYGQVKQLVDGLETQAGFHKGAADQLRAMLGLTDKIRARRRARGGLDFDVPEPFFELGLRGEVRSVIRNERHVGHFLIEELMIAANEAVAETLSEAGYPVMYRSHSAPPPDKELALISSLKAFGVRVPQPLRQIDLAGILDQYRGVQLQKVLQLLMLRSMAQAEYGVELLPHWGLVSACYCHFTSPIRRYPDLINHRLVKRWLRRGEMPPGISEKYARQLEPIAGDLGKLERNAESAERRMVRHLQMQVVSERAGEIVDGWIISVTSFGVFVELDDPFCDGLIHISNLGSDHWVYDAPRNVIYGRRSGKRWQLGDEVRVRIALVDLQQDRMDLEPV